MQRVLMTVLFILIAAGIADYVRWMARNGFGRFLNLSGKDIFNNLRVSYYGCALGVSDSFEKAALEKKMEEMGIRYMQGYNEHMGLYSYSVLGTKGRKQDDLADLLEWFKGSGRLQYFVTRNMIFRTKIYCFVRAAA